MSQLVKSKSDHDHKQNLCGNLWEDDTFSVTMVLEVEYQARGTGIYHRLE